MNGGEGGIRTPDSLATMSDFESGAFNRALPPLRFLFCCTYAVVMVPTNCLVVLLEIFSSRRFSHNPPAINRRGLVFWSEMRVPHDHLDVPCPSSSATVRRSTRP